MSDNHGATTGNILLEAGTNEFELLVFRLGARPYGVNVAKVREVIRTQPVIDLPHKHPAVVGAFQLRDRVLTLIDLRAYLGIPEVANDEEGADRSIVVTEFNGVRLGFLVDRVERIHRVSWSRMLPVPPLGIGGNDESASCTTGVVDLDKSLVLLVDFESVADAILSDRRDGDRAYDNPLEVDRASKRIVLAEDSPFMRTQIRRAMEAAGYAKAEIYNDGQAAWEAISRPGPRIDAIVSDIEMPRMDGLHLARRLKENAALANVPVVLFSSLVSEDNANKGRAVGALVQIPKPAVTDLVRVIDHVVAGRSLESLRDVVGFVDHATAPRRAAG